MKPLSPIDAVPLFPDERAALLELLRSLTAEQWALPTVCNGWSVKDIAAHILADDLGRLGWQRDGHAENRFEPSSPETFEAELRDFVNAQNELWVEAARRLSPRVIIDLLEWSGRETQALFEALDPDAMGLGVSWAGESESANWFDLAREYTERWHHQSQIREAVGAPMLYENRLYAPVIETFVRGVPHALRDLNAPDGTVVRLAVTEIGTQDWSVERQAGAWHVGYTSWTTEQHSGSTTVRIGFGEDKIDEPSPPEQVKHPDFDAFVALAPDSAWRVFTRNIAFDEAKRQALIVGDERLGEAVLQTFALVA